jgi:hypothetical protein
MAGEHDCAVEGCVSPAKPGQLMCWPHWKGLPRQIQNEVNSTWRRFRYEREPYLEARGKAIAYYANGGTGHPAQGDLL